MGESSKKERNFTITIDLNVDQTTSKQHQQQQQQPKLEIQSPKTPTLSRKLKAISLDSSDQTINHHQLTNNNNKKQHLDVINRDFISMPNTPKRQIKYKSCEFNDNLHNHDDDDDDDDYDYGCCSSSTNSGGSSTNNLLNHHNYHNDNNSNNNNDNNKIITTITTTTLLPSFTSNLKKFASNTSISGSQTLKTLPEVMTLHDFNNDIKIINRNNEQPIKMKAKGLLERRGSNASLTIDLSGSNSNICENNKTTTTTTTTTSSTTRTTTTFSRLNTARSVSNLNLSSFGGNTNNSNHSYCCNCKQQQQEQQQRQEQQASQRRKSQETCNNCTIYEFEPSKFDFGRAAINKCLSTTRTTTTTKRCDCNCVKYRRKSLSNENLYVPLRGCCQINGNNGFLNHTTKQQQQQYYCNNYNNNKNYRRAHYPRQPDLETLTLSEDFKIHLQNVQYLQTAGSVLSIDDLRAACEMSRVPKLHSEFWEVPLNLQEKSYVPGSHSRNRYKGVLPNEHSRVHLPGPQSYIHANYIRGPDYTETVYIATQGPMAHTCLDFWEMIWHTNCICIVMLTGLIEKGRNKCELYFPLGKKDKTKPKSFFYIKTTKERDKFTFGNYQQQPDNCEEIVEFEELNELTFGDYTIKYLDEYNLDECIIRRLEIIKNKESRIIKHFWYPNWQDHKMANPEQLLKIALHLLDLLENKIKTPTNKVTTTTTNTTKMELEMKKSSETNTIIKEIPLVVHCSAGIGRTGCFLAILNGIQQLKQNLNVDVLAILCSLRLNRGGMVQTAEQYELIHRVLNLYANTIESK